MHLRCCGEASWEEEVSDHILHELRRKYPGLARRCGEGSPMAALRLRCLDCCAGQPKEVELCPSTDCPSWNYRMGRRLRAGERASDFWTKVPPPDPSRVRGATARASGSAPGGSEPT